MEALRASRDQVPVLNMDGVCVFLGSARLLELEVFSFFFSEVRNEDDGLSGGLPIHAMWHVYQHIDSYLFISLSSTVYIYIHTLCTYGMNVTYMYCIKISLHIIFIYLFTCAKGTHTHTHRHAKT